MMLEIHYINKGFPEAPFVRLSVGDQKSLLKFSTAIGNLNSGKLDGYCLEASNDTENKTPIKLIFIRSQRTSGIEKISEYVFECRLDGNDFNNLYGLLEGVIEEKEECYQWLYDKNDIGLLITTYSNGTW